MLDSVIGLRFKNMVTTIRIIGLMTVVASGLSAFLGLLSLPAGGLMFALPHVFFLVAFCLGITGGACLWGARTLEKRSAMHLSETDGQPTK